MLYSKFKKLEFFNNTRSFRFKLVSFSFFCRKIGVCSTDKKKIEIKEVFSKMRNDGKFSKFFQVDKNFFKKPKSFERFGFFKKSLPNLFKLFNDFYLLYLRFVNTNRFILRYFSIPYFFTQSVFLICFFTLLYGFYTRNHDLIWILSCYPLVLGLFFIFGFFKFVSDQIVKIYAIWLSLFVFFCSLILYFKIIMINPVSSDIWCHVFYRYRWDWGFSFHSCLDGFSVYFVLLTTLSVFVCVVASWKMDFKNRCSEYFFLFFFMEFLLINVFTQQNLFWFFVFFESVLIPMFLLIGVWGSRKEQRIQASYRFFMYTFIGSIPMLIAIFYINAKVGTIDWFDFLEFPKFRDKEYAIIMQQHSITESSFPRLSSSFRSGIVDSKLASVVFSSFISNFNVMYQSSPLVYYEINTNVFDLKPILDLFEEKCLWIAFFISFAVKIPLIPFHTWLPEAHVEAPTPVSMFLAGVLLKMGGFGYLHFSLILFPNACAEFYVPFVICCLISILYASGCAITHIDFKKIIAYSSIAHMGFSMLGIAGIPTAQALTGSAIVMISHGFISMGLFFSVGFLYAKYHTRNVLYYKNVSILHPVFSPLYLFLCLSNIGFPGTSGFVGELIVLISVLKFNFFCGAVAASGMIFSSVYTLWTFNRVCWGSQNHRPQDDVSNPIFKIARFNVVEKNLSNYCFFNAMRTQGSEQKVFFLKYFLWFRFVFQKKFFWDCEFYELFIFTFLIFFIVGIGFFPSFFFSQMIGASYYYVACVLSHTAFSEWIFIPTPWQLSFYFNTVRRY